MKHLKSQNTDMPIAKSPNILELDINRWSSPLIRRAVVFENANLLHLLPTQLLPVLKQQPHDTLELQTPHDCLPGHLSCLKAIAILPSRQSVPVPKWLSCLPENLPDDVLRLFFFDHGQEDVLKILRVAIMVMARALPVKKNNVREVRQRGRFAARAAECP